jgi:hypothetical protein
MRIRIVGKDSARKEFREPKFELFVCDEEPPTEGDTLFNRKKEENYERFNFRKRN